MKKKEELQVIEIPASGKSKWMGGAWCLVFVYSNKGNFLLKGFIQECEDYIKSEKLKCWAFFQLHHGKSYPYGDKFRTIIRTFGVNFEVSAPYSSGKRKTHKDWKYSVYEKGNWKNKIYIKRLPKVFREFDLPGEKVVVGKKSNTLGDITLGSLNK